MSVGVTVKFDLWYVCDMLHHVDAAKCCRERRVTTFTIDTASVAHEVDDVVGHSGMVLTSAHLPYGTAEFPSRRCVASEAQRPTNCSTNSMQRGKQGDRVGRYTTGEHEASNFKAYIGHTYLSIRRRGRYLYPS